LIGGVTVSFDLVWWRELQSSVARETADGGQAICPFGFELLRDRSYLKRRLRRFYIYISFERSIALSGSDLCAAFTRILLERIRAEAPEFFADLGTVKCDHGLVLENPSGSAVIEIRSRPHEGDLLVAYAKYVIGIPYAIVQGRLRELQDFWTSPSCRRYIAQSVIMMNELFAEFGGQVSKSISSEMFLMLSRDTWGEEESRLLLAIACAQAATIVSAVSLGASSDRHTLVQVRDFHGPNIFSFSFPVGLLHILTSRIVADYVGFVDR
jgi:hypothetical protein